MYFDSFIQYMNVQFGSNQYNSLTYHIEPAHASLELWSLALVWLGEGVPTSPFPLLDISWGAF